MGKIHWYKRDPVAWLQGTRKLTPEQRGFYADIIELIMAHDGELEDDDKDVAAWIRCTVGKWRKIKAQLIEAGKISIECGKIINDRCKIEAESALNLIEKRSRAGQKSGEIRRHKLEETTTCDEHMNKPTTTTTTTKKENPPLFASQTSPPSAGERIDQPPQRPAAGRTLFDDDYPLAPPEPRLERADHEPPQKPETVPKPDAPPDGFDAWYAEFPRHVGKGAARTAYAKALRKVSAGLLLLNTRKFREHCERNGVDAQFIPHPATWLNAERWGDELRDLSRHRSRAPVRSKSAEIIELMRRESADECECDHEGDQGEVAGMPPAFPQFRRAVDG